MLAIVWSCLFTFLFWGSNATPLNRQPFWPPARASNTVFTPIGLAQGIPAISGAVKFPVRYATAGRWKTSQIATRWDFPNGSKNVSAIPLACPQSGLDPQSYTEDCLSMMLYVPPGLSPYSKAPVMMWIHGGSFVAGSLSAPGLDGSNLAIATKSIVAVIQYRLGALGYLAPCGATNLGAKDTVVAMQFLRNVVPAFGGDPAQITIAGQSSGGNMIRALLAVPTASSLFKSAIIQSDPMNYGFLSAQAHSNLQTQYNKFIGCDGLDYSCLSKLPLQTILDAQNNYTSIAPSIEPSAGVGEPIRVVKDGQFITNTMDSTTPWPKVSKPLLVTNVKDEAGYTIYSAFPDPIPSPYYPGVLDQALGSNRTDILVNSTFYPLPNARSAAANDIRPQLNTLFTDQMWRCPSMTFARSWVQNGGSAYVGLYTVGSSYPWNDDVSYCTQPGVVCHQDDIQIVFGTAPSPTAAQSAAIKEMQARYSSFFRTGTPNAASFPTWTKATTDSDNLLTIGSGTASPGACVPSFWGNQVQYDYQVYDI